MPETERMPIVACITVGMLRENCYLYACPETREAVIIDPGDEAQRIVKTIRKHSLIPRYILNTHGHFDHTGAIDAVSESYPVPLAIHEADAYMYTAEHMALIIGRKPPLVKRKPDMFLKEGDSITIGTLTLEVLHTPGHSPGGVCFVSRPYHVFSGDTLFYRSIGRTDLEGGNSAQLAESIRTKLYTLEDELLVFPGHGRDTSIIEEKHENPFVTIEE